MEAEVASSTAIRRFTKRSTAVSNQGQFVVDCVPDELLGQKISSSTEMLQKTNLGKRGGRKNPSASAAPSTPKQQQSATAKTQAMPQPKQQQSAANMGVVRMGKPQSKKDEEALKVHGFKGEIHIECQSLEKILQEMQQQHKVEAAEHSNPHGNEELKHDEEEKPQDLEMLGVGAQMEDGKEEQEKPLGLEKEDEEENQTGNEEEKEETEQQMEAKEKEKQQKMDKNGAEREEKQPVEEWQKDGENEEKGEEEKQTGNEQKQPHLIENVNVEEGKGKEETEQQTSAGNEKEKPAQLDGKMKEKQAKQTRNVEEKGTNKGVKRRKLVEEGQPELAENVEQKQKEGEKRARNVEEQKKQAEGKRVKRRKLVKSTKTRGKKRPAESSPENEPHPKKPKMTKEKARPTPSNQIETTTATPLVQCCMCELIVNRARFEGRDSVYCSAKCITKKVELARKCFKKSERVSVADTKGKVRNNLTLASLEQFLLEYPTFQPVINAEIEAANKEKDPTEQEKIEKIRAAARKAMETALVKRTTKSNMNFGGAKCQRTSAAIEAALFSFHKQQISERYWKWCKAFLDVLDDENNGYFCSVVREYVSAKQLVTIDPAQMKAPAPPPPKPALEQPLVAAADSTTRVNFNGTHFATASQHMSAEVPPNNAQPKVRTVVDEILDMQNSATTTSEAVTRRHHEHLFHNANCAICKRNMEKMHERYEKMGMDQQWEKHLAREQQRPQAAAAVHNDKNHFPNLGPTMSSGEMWQQIVQQREMKQRQFRLNLFLNDNTTPPPPMAARIRPTPTLNPPLAAESSGLTPEVTQMEIADAGDGQREGEQQETAEIVENLSHVDPGADAADEIQTLAGNDDQEEQQEEIDKTGKMWISPTLQRRLQMRGAASLLSHKENSAHGNAAANPIDDPAVENQIDEIQTLADKDEYQEEIDKTGELWISPLLKSKLMGPEFNIAPVPPPQMPAEQISNGHAPEEQLEDLESPQSPANPIVGPDQKQQEEEIVKTGEMWISPLLKSRLMGPEFNIAPLPPPQMPEPVSHGHAPEEQEDLESPQSTPEFSDLMQEVSDDDNDHPPPAEHPPAPAEIDEREEGELSDEKSDDDDPQLPAKNGEHEEGELSDSDNENAALGNENGGLEESTNGNEITPASGNGANTSGNGIASSKKRVRFQVPDNDNAENDAFLVSPEFRHRQQHFDQHLPHPQQQTPKRYQPYNRPPRSSGPAANRRQSSDSDGNAASSSQKWPGWENIRFFK